MPSNTEPNSKNHFILNYHKSFTIEVPKTFNSMFDDFILVIIIVIHSY